MKKEIKLSRRYALLLLKRGDNFVKLVKNCENEVTDEATIYTVRGEDFEGSIIYCYEIGRYIDYENIKAIKHQATKYTPDVFIFSEINW